LPQFLQSAKWGQGSPSAVEGMYRRFLFGVALAASCKSVVVIFTVWAITDRADHMREIAVVHVMTS